MRLSDVDLQEFRDRALQAASRGYSIALASVYMEALAEEVGQDIVPDGVTKASPEHLLGLANEALEQRAHGIVKKALVKKAPKKAKPAPEPEPAPEPKPEPKAEEPEPKIPGSEKGLAEESQEEVEEDEIEEDEPFERIDEPPAPAKTEAPAKPKAKSKSTKKAKKR